MDYYDLECADQETIHAEIKNKLMELNELMDYSETYHSYVFEEEISRIKLLDSLNNILIENEVPERFRAFSTDIDDCNFIGLNIEPYLNEDLMINEKDYKTINRMVKKALPYLKFIDEVLNNIGLDLHVMDACFEYNYNLNDIDYVSFNITDRYREIFDSRIEMKHASTKNKFRLLYFKNEYNLTGARIVGHDDKPIHCSRILGGEYIEHVEDLKKNGTFISNPNELCHMILEGIGELHDRFNNIANKYTKLVGKISKQ